MWSNSSKPCSRGSVLQRIWFSLGSCLSVLSLSFLIVFKFWLLIDFKTQLNGERERIRAIKKTLKHHILFFLDDQRVIHCWQQRCNKFAMRLLSSTDVDTSIRLLYLVQHNNGRLLFGGVRCLCWKHVHIKLVKAIFLAVIVPDQKKLV